MATVSLTRLAREALAFGLASVGIDAMARRRELRRMRARRTTFVRVAMFHATDANLADALRRQLLWLKQHFDLIDFTSFKRLHHEKPASMRPAVVLTFDDGYLSNYETAAPLLEELGTRGVFSIVPDFARVHADPTAAQAFFRNSIRGPERWNWKPKSPQQVRDLADRGHTIANHTMSHAVLSQLPPDQYSREIKQSADELEQWTGRPVEPFAWPFGHAAITPAAHRMIRARHAFCFTPCLGSNDVAVDSPHLIWRTNLEPDDPPARYRYFYSGLEDRLWASRRRKAEMLARG